CDECDPAKTGPMGALGAHQARIFQPGGANGTSAPSRAGAFERRRRGVGRDERHVEHCRPRSLHLALQRHLLCRAGTSTYRRVEEAADCRRGTPRRATEPTREHWANLVGEVDGWQLITPTA